VRKKPRFQQIDALKVKMLNVPQKTMFLKSPKRLVRKKPMQILGPIGTSKMSHNL